MGGVNTDIPDELHKALHNIKNNVDEAPDTIEDCFEAACELYADENWPEWGE